MIKKIENLKERIIGATGSISGIASILGSWQICHNVCLAIIAILSIIGITIVGMPLLFLTKLAVPLWILALVILLATMGLYLKKKCISMKLILFNSGLITAGVPFQSLQNFSIIFWISGGIIIIISILLFVRDRLNKKMCK